ncbi:hypothetical protein SAY86_026264 [Trapa natans]|uniref:Protein SHOOT GRAVITROPISM 5 n=1 Tax=Trapa natans TaxID=22666 RepID=A0AAN7KDI0_TRANT|nr:hypothetical protein SAY86_026264 [Trapa natans]
MHRRRHKMPWNLLKQDGGGGKAKKRVYVCPEPTCLHHDPAHALGDLVGIKKHFRRKHSSHKQWVCERCSKGYAVQSDYKAHLKTCGTRGHSCDCGRVFSRVESFIEHQDACTVRRAVLPDHSSLTGSSLSPSNGAPLMITTNPTIVTTTKPSINLQETNSSTSSHRYGLLHSLELQLQPVLTDLHLSVGPSCTGGEVEEEEEVGQLQAERLREFAGEQLRLAAAEKALAEEARRQARRQVELAEEEFAETKRIRLQAQSELERAHALKEEAMRRIASTITQVTCPACKRQFRAAPVVAPPPPCEEMSTHSFMSSATTTMEGDD